MTTGVTSEGSSMYRVLNAVLSMFLFREYKGMSLWEICDLLCENQGYHPY